MRYRSQWQDVQLAGKSGFREGFRLWQAYTALPLPGFACRPGSSIAHKDCYRNDTYFKAGKALLFNARLTAALTIRQRSFQVDSSQLKVLRITIRTRIYGRSIESDPLHLIDLPDSCFY